MFPIKADEDRVIQHEFGHGLPFAEAMVRSLPPAHRLDLEEMEFRQELASWKAVAPFGQVTVPAWFMRKLIDRLAALEGSKKTEVAQE